MTIREIIIAMIIVVLVFGTGFLAITKGERNRQNFPLRYSEIQVMEDWATRYKLEKEFETMKLDGNLSIKDKEQLEKLVEEKILAR